ncbi:MAG: divergent PAP2 family protein [Candidatus Margulisiibacteriota bacterium]|jgi:hypothetical protein
MKEKLLESYFNLYPLFAAVFSMFLAQILKIFFNYFKKGDVDIKRILGAGGMPSSHSAMVMGLTTAVGLKEGWTSTMFCISVVFALIVLYDAAGIRRAVGKQAIILNQILTRFLRKGEFRYEKLTELLGHTPLEVIMGSLLGIAVAYTLYY